MSRRLLAALGVAIVSATPAAPAPAAPHPWVVCDGFGGIAISPDFARDGTAACVAMDFEGTSRLVVSTDGARTWHAAGSLGLPPGAFVWEIAFSGDFAKDRAIFAQLGLGFGLWASTDLGETFLPVDPYANALVAGPHLAPLPSRAGSPAPPGGVAWSRLTRTTLAPDLPVRVTAAASAPVAGSPAVDWQFAIPPTYAAGGEALVFGLDTVTVATRLTMLVRAYACDAALTCTEPLGTLDLPGYLDGVWFDGGYARSRTLYARLRDPERPAIRFLRSTDGGRTFSVWAQPDAIAARLVRRGGQTDVSIATHPARPGWVVLRAAHETRESNPYRDLEEIWLSRDAGATWRLLATGRSTPDGRRHGVPWDGGGYGPRGPVTLLPDGRILLVGSVLPNNEAGPASYAGPFCSADLGRTWTRGCR